MSEEKERPAYVRFEKRAVEDRSALGAVGQVVCKDMDIVCITPPGSKDCIEREVAGWLDNLRVSVKDGRISQDLASRYERAYEFWKRGEEIPINGTAIKGWPVMSPSQQKLCIEAANIRTVEDLAVANGEAIARLGIGGYEMKQKAEAWLKAASSIGAVVQENVALRIKVTTLETQITALEARNAALAAQIPKQEKQPA